MEFTCLPSHLVRRENGQSLRVAPAAVDSRWSSSVIDRVPCLITKDLRAHYGCVNAIEFSNNGGRWIASGGDDRRVLLWNVQEAISGIGVPSAMKGEHHSNIFCIAFDNCNKKIFSSGNDEQVLVHDAESGEILDVFTHEDAVYGLSVDTTNDSIFASACDDGRILIYDIRAAPREEPYVLAQSVAPMHAVQFNPVDPSMLVTANSKHGVALWDIRRPKQSLLKFGPPHCSDSCMSVRFNQRGDRVLALRRRLPPALYAISSPECLVAFEQAGYYNSCTMKSCTFAGDRDQYVLSGSDDFKLYMWKVPAESASGGGFHGVKSAHLVLSGHRSIVNQVRYNACSNIIISSGVEKVIKVWSPFRLPGFTDTSSNGRTVEFDSMPVYSRDEYIEMMLRGIGGPGMMTHDYTHQSTEEDPRMLAFFDSLVKRDMEDQANDDDDSDEPSPLFFPHSDVMSSSDSENSSSDREFVTFRPPPQSRSSLLTNPDWTAHVADRFSNDETVIFFGRRRTTNVAAQPNRSTDTRGRRRRRTRQHNVAGDAVASAALLSSSSTSISSSSSSSSNSDSDDNVDREIGANVAPLEFSANAVRTVSERSATRLAEKQRSANSLNRLKQLRKRVMSDDESELPIKTRAYASTNRGEVDHTSSRERVMSSDSAHYESSLSSNRIAGLEPEGLSNRLTLLSQQNGRESVYFSAVLENYRTNSHTADCIVDRASNSSCTELNGSSEALIAERSRQANDASNSETSTKSTRQLQQLESENASASCDRNGSATEHTATVRFRLNANRRNYRGHSADGAEKQDD